MTDFLLALILCALVACLYVLARILTFIQDPGKPWEGVDWPNLLPHLKRMRRKKSFD